MVQNVLGSMSLIRPELAIHVSLRLYYFFLFSSQVIEVVIRFRGGTFQRHGETPEQHRRTDFESLAWSHDSALWEALQASVNRVPTCEEVS